MAHKCIDLDDTSYLLFFFLGVILVFLLVYVHT
jgi:hypothetical protein